MKGLLKMFKKDRFFKLERCQIREGSLYDYENKKKNTI